MGKTGPTGGKKSITKKTKDNEEYLYSEYGSRDENRESPPSTDLNDMDMELLRVAFASAKSKNAKNNNVEFMKQQKALVDAAREQAEVIKSAGNAHLAKIIGELDALCVPPDRSDLLAIATLIGNRREAADKLFESSTLSLEELAGSYDGAIQAAGEEFESRPARREKIRRHTIRQAHHILEQGVEEQKLITDATDLIQNFQRLMKA